MHLNIVSLSIFAKFLSSAMENRKFKKVFDFSHLNLVGVLEQRRGIRPPQKPEFVRTVEAVYVNSPKAPYAAKFKSLTPEWIAEERSGKPLPKQKGKLVYTRALPSNFYGVRSLRFTADEENLVVGYGSGNIEIWPVFGEEDPVTIKPVQKQFPITSMCFVPNSKKFFAANTCGILYTCNLEPIGCTEFVKEFEQEINTIDVCQSDSKVITGGKDAAIRLYDGETAKKTSEFKRDNTLGSFPDEDHYYHALRILAIKFHPDFPDVFVSGGLDGYAKIWDVRIRGGCVRNFHGPFIRGEAIEVKGCEILTGSFQTKNSIQRWDVLSGNLIENVSLRNRSSVINGEFPNTLRYLASDPFQNIVVTGGLSPNVEVVDLIKKKVVFRFPVYKKIIAVDSSRNFLAFGGYSNVLKVAKYKPRPQKSSSQLSM